MFINLNTEQYSIFDLYYAFEAVAEVEPWVKIKVEGNWPELPANKGKRQCS